MKCIDAKIYRHVHLNSSCLIFFYLKANDGVIVKTFQHSRWHCGAFRCSANQKSGEACPYTATENQNTNM